LIGTASDRYAGWIGQIYSEGRYENGITRRSHKVGDKTFNEETLPLKAWQNISSTFPCWKSITPFTVPFWNQAETPLRISMSSKTIAST
jgi:hypothetical protein